MNDGASNYSTRAKLSSYGAAAMNTTALSARMHDRMHHRYHLHHLGGPNVARGAPKAKVRDVMRIRTDTNHSGQ